MQSQACAWKDASLRSDQLCCAAALWAGHEIPSGLPVRGLAALVLPHADAGALLLICKVLSCVDGGALLLICKVL